jgi:TRAP-type C4-dicarboxylate transport system permease large subunit
MSLFISSLRFEQPMTKIILASLPFIAVLLFVLAIITYVPWLSLGLLR